jgi:hypothetical protein
LGYGIIALDGPLCRGERFKPQAWIHATRHEPMALFHDII